MLALNCASVLVLLPSSFLAADAYGQVDAMMMEGPPLPSRTSAKTALSLVQLYPPSTISATGSLMAIEGLAGNGAGVISAVLGGFGDNLLGQALRGAQYLKACRRPLGVATGRIVGNTATRVLTHSCPPGTIDKILSVQDTFGQNVMGFNPGEWGVYFAKPNRLLDLLPRKFRVLSSRAGAVQSEKVVFKGEAAELLVAHPLPGMNGTYKAWWEGVHISPFNNLKLLEFSHDAATGTLVVTRAELVANDIPKWRLLWSWLVHNNSTGLLATGGATAGLGFSVTESWESGNSITSQVVPTDEMGELSGNFRAQSPKSCHPGQKPYEFEPGSLSGYTEPLPPLPGYGAMPGK